MPGYAGYGEHRRIASEHEVQALVTQGKPHYPKVSTPEVRAVWIPDKIENDQFVSGHYIYVIDKPATFRQE